MAPINTLPVIAAAGFSAVAVNWALVAGLIRFAPKIGLLDRPNNRSLHTKVTPRGGGLGFVVFFAVALGTLLLLGVIAGELRSPLMVYLGAALFIATVSLRDDFKSLSPGLRLPCQLAAAVAAVTGVASFGFVSIPLMGSVHLGWAGAMLTVVWIVGLTNVYNFMDGIDGIAGVQGVAAGLAWVAVGAWSGASAITLLGILLAAGCLGFLFHNWSPARIFMGDVGSAFLGYSFAVLPLLLLRSQSVAGGNFNPGLVPVLALLVVWPFVGDGLYTFIRRALRREAVWKPHRSHLYQRLAQSGWSHAGVSSLYAVWCAVSALAGLSWLVGPGAIAAGLTVVSLGALGAVYLLVSSREKRNGPR